MEYQGRHYDLTKKMDAILFEIRAVCDDIAAKAEQYAKDNAGWTDRTGDARKLLHGEAIDDGHDMGFAVMHRAKSLGKTRVRDTKNGKKGETYGAGIMYGKYLEGWDEKTGTLTHKGKYPVLKDAVEHFREEFLRRVREAVANGGKTG
jgi:hypothetical protein